MHRVTTCFDEGRGPPNRQVLVEGLINEFCLLASASIALPIRSSEANRVLSTSSRILGEDWTLMQNYGRGFFNPESQRLEQRAKLREKEQTKGN